MKAAAKALLTGLIDYAGLFPPAGLDMETAISNWLDYERSEDAFLLHSFICPAWRLDELAPHVRGREEAFPVSILIRPGPNLAADIGNAMDFGERFEAVEVVGVEGKLPAIDPAAVQDLVERLRERRVPGTIWIETGFPEGWEEALPGFVAGLPPGAGFKVRCGGLVPEAFPSIRELAAAIGICRKAARPMKATAGLHHPVRHHDEEIGAKMHGFLNVFGAIAFARALDPGAERIAAVLAEEEAQAFVFTDSAFEWRGLSVPVEELGEHTSFGSCSFDEPRADLRALGIL